MRRMYTINSKTLMIVPIDIWNTKIIETDQEIILRINYMSIIDFNCKIYGSSYIGRAESSKLLLGINNKLPVIIEESTNMIYFPTASPRNIKCWWIAYSNVVNYIKRNNTVTVLFKNNKRFTLDISYNVFQKQFLKAHKLIMMNQLQKNLLK